MSIYTRTGKPAVASAEDGALFRNASPNHQQSTSR